MALAKVLSGEHSRDIILGDGDPRELRKQEEAELEKRKQEESGPVNKRKATPIEYLLLFGQVPRLDQVQQMKPEDLNKEDAERLLKAGCPKNHLAKLYGYTNVGGIAYRLKKWGLYDLALSTMPPQNQGQQNQIRTTAGDKLTLDKMKRYVPVPTEPFISVRPDGKVYISRIALIQGPVQEKFKAGIYTSEDAQVIAIHPESEGYSFFTSKGQAAYTNAKSFVADLLAAGVKCPAKYQAAWDPELQAWVGRIV